MILYSGKGLGSASILLACIGSGILYGRMLYARQKELRGLIEILQLLYGELEYQMMILPEAMIQCGNKVGGVIGDWFAETGRQLLAADGIRFCELWESKLRELFEISTLTRASIEELKVLGIHLAEPDKQSQLQVVHRVLLRLQDQEHLQQTKLPGQIRCSTSLMLLIGAFLIIILY